MKHFILIILLLVINICSFSQIKWDMFIGKTSLISDTVEYKVWFIASGSQVASLPYVLNEKEGMSQARISFHPQDGRELFVTPIGYNGGYQTKEKGKNKYICVSFTNYGFSLKTTCKERFKISTIIECNPYKGNRQKEQRNSIVFQIDPYERTQCKIIYEGTLSSDG